MNGQMEQRRIGGLDVNSGQVCLLQRDGNSETGGQPPVNGVKSAKTLLARSGPFKCGLYTYKGKRSRNDDAVALRVNDDGVFMVLLDGVGQYGPTGGKMALQTAKWLVNNVTAMEGFNIQAFASCQEALCEQFGESNRHLEDYSTCFSAVYIKNDGTVRHCSVGNTRVYFLNQSGEIISRTIDQSPLGEFERSELNDLVSKDGVTFHFNDNNARKRQSAAYRKALGDEEVKNNLHRIYTSFTPVSGIEHITFSTYRLKLGDSVACSSDGFHDHVTPTPLANGFRLKYKVSDLLRWADQSTIESPDNVSVIAVQYGNRQPLKRVENTEASSPTSKKTAVISFLCIFLSIVGVYNYFSPKKEGKNAPGSSVKRERPANSNEQEVRLDVANSTFLRNLGFRDGKYLIRVKKYSDKQDQPEVEVGINNQPRTDAWRPGEFIASYQLVARDGQYQLTKINGNDKVKLEKIPSGTVREVLGPDAEKAIRQMLQIK